MGKLVQVKTLSNKYQKNQVLKGFENSLFLRGKSEFSIWEKRIELYRRAYENRLLKWSESLRREPPLD
jgi:hypothetical protein